MLQGNHLDSYNSLCDALNIDDPLSRNTGDLLRQQCKDELEQLLQSLPDGQSWLWKEDGKINPLMQRICNVMQTNNFTVENNSIGAWLQRQGDVISKPNLRLLANALSEAAR